ncbi:multicopper oxidase family protein [Rhodococcus sp. NPDC004095]
MVLGPREPRVSTRGVTVQGRAIGRRSVLRALGVGGVAFGLGVARPVAQGTAQTDGFKSPLLFHSPPTTPFRAGLEPLPTVSGSRLRVAAVNASHRFHPDHGPASTLAYRVDDTAVSYLGPTIEAHVDQPVVMEVTNEIQGHPLAADLDLSLHGVSHSYRSSPPIVLHLHGGETPPDSDGHAEQLIHPGTTLTHRFPNHQEAAHLWYHDHAMGITRANVYAGLAGTYFLRDRFDTGTADNPLGLPAGEFEMPLILQERILRADGGLSLRSTPVVPSGSWEGGAVGDLGLVNGAVWPDIPVARGLYRFRAINGSSYSVWNLHFDNHMRFWVIGNDGGLLDAPVPTTSIRMSPGERYDLLVDFSDFDAGGSVHLCNDEAPPFQAAMLGEVAMPLFCRFTVGSERGFRGPVPATLRAGGRTPDPLPPLPTPSVIRNVSVSQPYALRIPPAYMALNNLRYTDPDIEMPRAGTVEQWNIVNVTDDPHPIHLHLVMFRILGRAPLRTVELQATNLQPPLGIRWTPDPEPYLAGPMLPPAPWEAGWKDTVRVDRGTVTRILVRFPTADELGFDPDASFPAPSAPAPTMQGSWTPIHNGIDHGTGHGDPVADTENATTEHADHASHPAGGDLQGYMWHCHILDHEDHEMMLRYRVVT